MMDCPLVSVVITTRNRKRDVLVALESCLGQSYQPLEVRVYDDASGDGTEAAVRACFPDVRYHRSEKNVGLVQLRDHSLHEAQGRYVFSLDDDAYYSDPDTVAKTVAVFRDDPKVAAVAIPFVEPNKPPPRAQSIQPFQPLRSYIGCAHALDRQAALMAGGYRGFFFRQGEERDLCIRLLELDRSIVYGTGEPVVHLYSPTRSYAAMSYYGIRNQLLCDYLNVPQPYTLPLMFYHSLRLFRHKLRPDTFVTNLGYLICGWCACVRYARLRRPVSRATFRRMRKLPFQEALPATREYAPVRLPFKVTREV